VSDLEQKTLAELHELAAKTGIEGFRRKRREELIDELDDAGASGEGGSSARDASGDGDGDGAGRESRSRRRRGRGGRDRSRRSDGDRSEGRTGDRQAREERDEDGDDELSEAKGVLDIQPRGSGLIRGEGLPDAGVYVSPAQIRRCELRSGDEVAGPVRPARRGERRPSLVRVETVNGEPPTDERGTAFEGLTPVAPHRRIPLAAGDEYLLARAADLLAPLAFGQRVLIESGPRSGRTTLLRQLASSMIAAPGESPEVIVLLVDERPEEVTSWKRAVDGASIEAAPADLGAHEQVRVAERVLAKVRRQAEAGGDVVLIVDSLTRLGTAYGEAGSIKPFFGTGRELEEESAGSVTVVATVLSGAPGDEQVISAVKTTENSSVALDAALAAAGVTPAIDPGGCAISGQESLLSEKEVDALRKLRAELSGLEAEAAAARMAEVVRSADDNAAALDKL
jgi:transcription termination factor Rho